MKLDLSTEERLKAADPKTHEWIFDYNNAWDNLDWLQWLENEPLP